MTLLITFEVNQSECVTNTVHLCGISVLIVLGAFHFITVYSYANN